MSAPPVSVVPFEACATYDEANQTYQAEFRCRGYGSETPLADLLRLMEDHRLACERIKNAPDAKAARDAEKAVWSETPPVEDQHSPPVAPQPVATKAKNHRVTLAELEAAGLIQDGERFTWLYKDTRHEAWYRAGKLHLGNGVETETPSAVCSLANGGGSFNGWKFWTNTDGKTFSDLRATAWG